MIPLLNTKDLDVPWTRWFIYGATGSGKTTLASKFPRPLFLVPKTENSVTTLAGLNFPYITIKDRSSPFADGVGGLDASLAAIEKWYNKDPNNFPFETIIVESITHYMELVIDELTQGTKVQMDQGKYGILAGHMRNIHTRLSQMQCHIVYIALDKVDEKSGKGEPYLPGKTGDLLPSACEVFAHLVRKNNGKNNPDTFELHTKEHAIWQARSRLQRLPPCIVNFDWSQVQHLLTNIDQTKVQPGV